jgi:hypothetical protein
MKWVLSRKRSLGENKDGFSRRIYKNPAAKAMNAKNRY